MAENLTMLVIDSDRQYAKNLTDYAKSDSSFLDADYALNGNDGLELAELIKPDVIVMDFLIQSHRQCLQLPPNRVQTIL